VVLLSNSRVEDAGSAQAAARRYLAAQFGKKLQDVVFSRAWYRTGAMRDIWEVEGDITVKKGWFSKDQLHFKFQIDPQTGNVIAYEV